MASLWSSPTVVVGVGAVVALAGAVVVVAGAGVVVGAERVPVPPPPPVPVCASAKPDAPASNAADNPDIMINFLMSDLLRIFQLYF